MLKNFFARPAEEKSSNKITFCLGLNFLVPAANFFVPASTFFQKQLQ